LRKEGPYLDAGCTMLLSEVKLGAPLHASTGDLALAADCSGATAYTLGDAVTPPVVYFKRSTCEPRPPSVGVVYRSAMPAVDSSWAPLTERVE
jgi:hypothetical protein